MNISRQASVLLNSYIKQLLSKRISLENSEERLMGNYESKKM